MSSLVVATPPVLEPVTLGEARAQLRLDSAGDSGLLAGYLLAARQHVEDYTARALIARTYDAKLNWSWPRDTTGARIVLAKPPLVSVTSITYVDTNGTTQTLAANQYQVSLGDTFGVIVPAYGVSWPSVRAQLDTITVRYVAGYGSNPSDVPEPIRQAILLLTAHFYENREAVIMGTIATELPLTVQALLSRYRAELL